MLITDGKQTTISRPDLEPDQYQVSKAMKDRNITIYAMAIAAADPIELLRIASNALLILSVQDFEGLDAEVDNQARLLCPRKLSQKENYFFIH